jgi:hypothetical protein
LKRAVDGRGADFPTLVLRGDEVGMVVDVLTVFPR